MPKNLGLYNDDLSVPRKKDIDELVDEVDGKVSKSGDTMTGTLTVGSASLQTNGYVTGTWLKTTANVALNTAPSQIAVLNGGWVYSRTPSQIKSDIGLGNVDNVKQYSVSNPPPYPVTSVNGQTGAVTVDVELPTNLVKYEAISDVESVDSLNADTLQGHPASYFATDNDIATAANKIRENANAIGELMTEQSNLSSSIDDLSTSKVSKTGGTMNGVLVAQSNTNYTTAQVRNIILSTSEPQSEMNLPGCVWIKYQA